MLLLPRRPILISCTSDAPPLAGDDDDGDDEDSRSEGDDAEVAEDTTTETGEVFSVTNKLESLSLCSSVVREKGSKQGIFLNVRGKKCRRLNTLHSVMGERVGARR